MSRDLLHDQKMARLSNAEALGTVTGALAVGESTESAAQLGAAIMAGRGALGADSAASLIEVARRGEAGLFAPLEDKSVALGLRVESMAAWARGFLSGLGQAGARLATAGADGADMLRDLESISHGASLEGDPDAPAGEEEEQALAELLEYLRFVAEFFRRALA